MFWSRKSNFYPAKAVITVIFLVLVLLAGCGGEEEEKFEKEDSGDTADTDTVTVVDHKDREVEVSLEPEKIVSLSPSNTETVYALGLEDNLVGVTDYCNYPPEVEEKPVVGGYVDPNREKIMELNPDLVLADSMHEQEVHDLQDLGMEVVVLAPENFEEIFEAMDIVGEITNRRQDYRELKEELEARLEAVSEKVKDTAESERVRVYYEVDPEHLIGAGKGSIVHEIVTAAGGSNIFGDIDNRYPQLSAEEVLERQPEVVLFPDDHGTADIPEQMDNRPGWSNIPAVQEDRIHAVSGDMFSRAGPRVVEAVEIAAELFYPEQYER